MRKIARNRSRFASREVFIRKVRLFRTDQILQAVKVCYIPQRSIGNIKGNVLLQPIGIDEFRRILPHRINVVADVKIVVNPFIKIFVADCFAALRSCRGVFQNARKRKAAYNRLAVLGVLRPDETVIGAISKLVKAIDIIINKLYRTVLTGNFVFIDDEIPLRVTRIDNLAQFCFGGVARAQILVKRRRAGAVPLRKKRLFYVSVGQLERNGAIRIARNIVAYDRAVAAVTKRHSEAFDRISADRRIQHIVIVSIIRQKTADVISSRRRRVRHFQLNTFDRAARAAKRHLNVENHRLDVIFGLFAVGHFQKIVGPDDFIYPERIIHQFVIERNVSVFLTDLLELLFFLCVGYRLDIFVGQPIQRLSSITDHVVHFVQKRINRNSAAVQLADDIPRNRRICINKLRIAAQRGQNKRILRPRRL